MQELDVEGLFWRPEEPDRKIAGHLRFNSTDGAILSLIEPWQFNPTDGSSVPLSELMGGGPGDGDGFRLLGVAGSQRLTLDKCQEFGTKFDSTSMIRRRYRVRTVLSGAHLDGADPMRFSSVTVQVGNLTQWVG